MSDQQSQMPPQDPTPELAPPPMASAAELQRQERKRALTRKERRIGERIAELGIFAVATVSILAIFLIFVFVFREASPIFFGDDREPSAATQGSTTGGELEAPAPPPTALPGREDYPVLDHDSPVKVSYLWYDLWQPNSEHPAYGIIPIIIGTLKTTLVSLLIATPLGIFAALYTANFAPLWVREYLKPVIELLAAFPSVVVGFFCLMTVASIVQSVFGNEIRLNAVVGGIGLSIAVIPIIYTITDDALRAVPRSLREAALALGASEWQAAYQVVLPAATPGIVAAVLLGLGRAFGETMIALMATGNGQVLGWDLFVSVRTFAATIGAEMGEVVTGSPHYQVLFFLGVLLFIFSFVINFVTEFYVKRKLIKRFRGGE